MITDKDICCLKRATDTLYYIPHLGMIGNGVGGLWPEAPEDKPGMLLSNSEVEYG